jgi:PTS system cellobiose-specific IIA component
VGVDHDSFNYYDYFSETHNRRLRERGLLEMDMEMIVMKLVVSAGNARSTAIEALRAAKNGEFDLAEEQMEDADRTILEAHEIQTEMIQNELNGNKVEVGLLMVHAQDHLMNAMTVMDLCKEMIDILRKNMVS